MRSLHRGTAALAVVLLGSPKALAQSSWWSTSAPVRASRQLDHSCIAADPIGAVRIADQLTSTDRASEALHCLELSMKYHPGARETAIARVSLLARLGHQGDAVDALAKINPPDGHTLAAQGDIARYSGDKAGAVAKYKEALARLKADGDSGGAAVAARLAELWEPVEGANPRGLFQHEGEEQKAEERKDEEHKDEGAGGKHEGEAREADEAGGAGEAHEGGEGHEGKSGEGHEGKSGEGEEHEGSRVMVGYSHAKSSEDTLVDKRLGAAIRGREYSGEGALHLLTSTGGDATGGKVLDLGVFRSWSEGRTGLLLGAALGSTDVSYKQMFGLRHEIPMAGETTVGVDLRRLKYPDGSDTALGVDGRMALEEHWFAGGRLDYAAGAVKGAALTVRGGYEAGGLEAQAFAVFGHGIPAHPYLAPEGDGAFHTLGIDLDKSLMEALSLGLGVERRVQGDDAELEISFALAWEF